MKAASRRSFSTIRSISAPPTLVGEGGLERRGRVPQTRGLMADEELPSSVASIRSAPLTAPTIVWCGVSLSITAIPRTADRRRPADRLLSERLANTTAKLAAMHRLSGPALRREHRDHLAVARLVGRGRCGAGDRRRFQAGLVVDERVACPVDGREQLIAVERRREHVTDARFQGPMQDVRRHELDQQQSGEVTTIAETFLDNREGGGRCARRTEHDDGQRPTGSGHVVDISERADHDGSSSPARNSPRPASSSTHDDA